MKRFLTILLSLCMMVAMMPTMASTAYAENSIALTEDGGALSGDYYLADDVTLSSNIVVSSGETLTLDLNDGILNLNGHIIVVKGTFILKDTANSAVRYFYDSDSDGCYESYSETAQPDSIEITGGVITGGNAFGFGNSGGAIRNFGTFNMQSGNLVGNKVTATTKNTVEGGAVANWGTFNLSGGRISGNLVSGDTESSYDNFGGGVFNAGLLNMTGGSITNNTAKGNADNTECVGVGGGVENQGTFNFIGGDIKNNYASAYGGGFESRWDGSVTMTGGTVSGNSAGWTGSGIYIDCTSTGATFIGGTVSGNTSESTDCAGVYTDYSETVIGGTFNVTGNTCKSSDSQDNMPCNLYIYDVSITVQDDYTGTCGVTFSSKKGVFTKEVSSDVKGHFTSDASDYIVKYNNDHKLEIGFYSITVDDAIENGTISVSTKEAKPGDSISIIAVADEGFNAVVSAYKSGDQNTNVEVNDGEFIMPEYDVTVTAEFTGKVAYGITVDSDITGGTVLSDKTETWAGDTVTLSCTSESGYSLHEYVVTTIDEKNVTVENGKFTMPEGDVTVSAIFSSPTENVKYIDEDGAEQNCSQATEINENTTALTAGWYVVNGDVSLESVYEQVGTLIVSGDVHLILADGATLSCRNYYGGPGIKVSGTGNSLTIYGQSGQTGTLIAIGFGGGAAIGGGPNESGENITINGGIVKASIDSGDGAGIGGGAGGSGNNITINGGTVTAEGGMDTSSGAAAGIGGGNNGSGNNITINGGTVTATGGYGYEEYNGGAGIGGGAGGSGNNITINGGTVTATGGSSDYGECGAGIGGGGGGNVSNITFDDALAVTADAQNAVIKWKNDPEKDVEYIDANGDERICLEAMVIKEDTTTLRGDLCKGWYVVNDDITISDGNHLTVSGDVHLILKDGKTLTINGVTDDASGINVTGDNTLTIYGQSGQTGALTVTGGKNGAGIGGSNSENGSNITINGGVITATGGENGAGIGGGNGGSGSDIKVTRGTVVATGGNNADGIGNGYNGSSSSNISVKENLLVLADKTENPEKEIDHETDEDISTGFNDKQYVEIFEDDRNIIVYHSATGGKVTGLIQARPGKTVTVTATADAGYELDQITVTTASGDVTVTNNTFTMPEKAVNVSATFKKVEHTLTVKYEGAGETTTTLKTLFIGDPYDIATPVKEGYTFDMSSVSGTMGAEDKTITVTYTKTPDVFANATYNADFVASGNDVVDVNFTISNIGDTLINDELIITIDNVCCDFEYADGEVSASAEHDKNSGDVYIVVYYEGEKVKELTYSIESTHIHAWSYNASGDTITATCTTTSPSTCDNHTTADTLTIQAPSAETLTYDGTSKAAIIKDDKSSIGGVKVSSTDIKYQKKTGKTWTDLSAAPVDAGDYRASITVDNDKVAYVEYTIKKANQTQPALNEGYTIDYAKETLKAQDGYEVSSTSTTDVTALTNDKAEAGATYYVRKVEKDNYFASSWTAITIVARPSTPEITIDYLAETINTVTTQQYSLDNGNSWNDCTADMSVSDWTGKTILIRVKAVTTAGNESYASEAQTLNIPVRPSAPTLKATEETLSNKKDAKLTGVTEAMEYKLAAAENWTAGTGEDIANPDNAEIKVRVKASQENKNFVGEVQSISFTPSTKKLSIKLMDGSDVKQECLVSYGDKLTKPADPTKTGYTFAGWYKDKEYQTKWNFESDTVTEDGTIYAGWIRNEIKDETSGDLSNTKTSEITELVVVNDDTDTTATMQLITEAAKKTGSSKTEESSLDVENASVGGLASLTKKVKDESSNTDKDVKIVLVVSEMDDTAIENNAAETDLIKQTIENNTETGESKVDFLAIDITKYITTKTSGASSSTKTESSAITDTASYDNLIIEIVIPYDVTDKEDIVIARYHEDAPEGEKVKIFEQNESKADGTFYIEGTGKEAKLHIFSTKFSTYAVAYTATNSSGNVVPGTGDGWITLYAGLALMSAIGLCAITTIKKKNEQA